MSRHAHVVITQPCAHALPVLREAGLTVSTDLHDWDGSDPCHEPFLSRTALADPERTMRRIIERAGPGPSSPPPARTTRTS